MGGVFKVFNSDDLMLLFYSVYLKKNFMAPFYGQGSTVLRLQSHYEETVYFLLLLHSWPKKRQHQTQL